MTFLDRFLQGWRVAKARCFLPEGVRVLDIGSADGVLFTKLPRLSRDSLGIDPTLKTKQTVAGVTLLPGFFPADMPASAPFDAITMLAVLEHFPATSYASLADGCARFLKPGGKVIITVPSPAVDQILAVLVKLRLVDGMSLEEHHGFKVDETLNIFAAPRYELVQHGTFQLGLNNLFVFSRTTAPA